MNLNLLLKIDDFRWENISIDRSECMDSFSELLEVLLEEEDIVWHHPDIYTLCYDWGCVHDFVHNYDYESSKGKTLGWMKQRHYKTLKNLWLFCRHQSAVQHRTLLEFRNAFPDKLTGLMSCSEIVKDESSRFDLQITFCSGNNNLIDWGKFNHLFLPNIMYSNLYLSQRLGKSLNTDLKERKKELPIFAKEYCDNGFKKDSKGGSKEANADAVGTEVARRNFYRFEQALTQEEEKRRGKTMRKIFSVFKGGEKIYLSIDFEKGNCFELCDSKGEHQGEFRFDGIENGKTGSTKDTSGDHDIWSIARK